MTSFLVAKTADINILNNIGIRPSKDLSNFRCNILPVKIIISSQTLNKARIGRRGAPALMRLGGRSSQAGRTVFAGSSLARICAIYKHFSGFEFFLLPSRVHARPSAMLRERKPLGISFMAISSLSLGFCYYNFRIFSVRLSNRIFYIQEIIQT